MIEENKILVDAGFALVPLRPRSKIPQDEGWTNAAIPTVRELERIMRSDANIGARLGGPSTVDDLILHVIDLDIRDPDSANEAELELEELFGRNIWDLPRVASGSRNGSCHIYVACERAFPSRLLAKSNETVRLESGKISPKWAIEWLGKGRQVVLPPSIHPDSGRKYVWERKFDISRPPRVPVAALEALVDPSPRLGEWDEEPVGISLIEAERALDALDFEEWGVEYGSWIRVCMALKHEFGQGEDSDEALELFLRWSSQCESKFNRRNAIRSWKNVKNKTSNPVTMRTILKEAKIANESHARNEIMAMFDEMDTEERSTENQSETLSGKIEGVPSGILSIPGRLQAAVDYYNATAFKPQPQFAVGAALALASVVLGRNFSTDRDNYSNIYLLHVAETGAGKEHGRTVVERILEASGHDHLIGPKDYASEAGVLSVLQEKVRHITISDEFGRHLKAARTSGDAHRHDVQSSLMEAFSARSLRPKGYSMRGLKAAEAKAMVDRKIMRPSITLLGLTTPGTLDEALGAADVRDGFLNRLIVVRSELGRQLSRDVPSCGPPPTILKWIRRHVARNADDDGDYLERLDVAGEAPNPEVIPFSSECKGLLREIEVDALKEMERLEKFGLSEIFLRSRELAMRIGLIVALSCESKTVEVEHLEWARQFVFFYHRQMAENLKKNLGKSDIERVCEEVVDRIRRSGRDGITIGRIANDCRSFKRMRSRDREEVLARAKTDYGVVSSRSLESKRGPRTERFFLPERAHDHLI